MHIFSPFPQQNTSRTPRVPPLVPLASSAVLPFRRTIPKQGNTAEIKLTVLHRNFLGVDEFLGQTSVALSDYDVYEQAKNR